MFRGHVPRRRHLWQAVHGREPGTTAGNRAVLSAVSAVPVLGGLVAALATPLLLARLWR